MRLILCHTTADFDTLGAAIGLSRLEAGSRIVLSGGSHPAVRDFLALYRDEFRLIERRSVRQDQISAIGVVDTQLRDRLGKTAEWLDLPVPITIYDHHPQAECDIPAQTRYVEAIGASTTIVVEQLQAAGIALEPLEATVMALGIHVDTGSLTFSHTHPRDAAALTWLMHQGAHVAIVADYLERGLSPRLQTLLGQALEQLHREMIEGYVLAWVCLQTPEFMPGLSGVIAHLMDLTDADAMFLAHQYGGEGESGREGGEELQEQPISLSLPLVDPKQPLRPKPWRKMTVIGRSRIPQTDLNELLQPWGGGGHAQAAALNVRTGQQPPAPTDGEEVTLADLDDLLLQILTDFRLQIPKAPTARELMSSPVRTIRPETTIAEAQRVLLRYGHSGLSVVDAAGQLVGVISRRDLDIAFHHGFSHAKVKGYMTRQLKTIAPEATLPEIESLMVTYDIGRLPVLEGDRLVGIVTRTDVLRQLYQQRPSAIATPTLLDGIQDSTQPCFNRPFPRPWNLRVNLQRLAEPLQDLLAIAARLAEERGWHLYLVGGGVRDLLLASGQARVMLNDLDLVVDGYHRAAEAGAGVELAKELQRLYPEARLEVHGKFQTAALLWHRDPVLDSLWVDIATARTEFYPYPAANPEVEASSIQQDLYRRDFTINALAVRLTQPRAGDMLDFFGGVQDLQEKRVRVLHANSFIEDPTRIYRGVRFATRLGFEFDEQTEDYIRHAIASGIHAQTHLQIQAQGQARIVAPALQTRLKAELKYVLQTPYWRNALQRLDDLQALSCIYPTIHMTRSLWQALRWAEWWIQQWSQPLDGRALAPGSGQSATITTWQTLLEVIIASEPQPELRQQIAQNLQLPLESIDRLTQLATVEQQFAQTLPHCDRPSQKVGLFNSHSPSMLILVAARGDRTLRRNLWHYWQHWGSQKSWLNGSDLKTLGYKPGKQFKQILEEVLAATLDGELTSQAAAIAYVRDRYPL
ncbi:MAG: CBS domain-containing protein [Synechococcales bacterium]|nr:CBS domain-containing protein [Synechococcales bacterium]